MIFSSLTHEQHLLAFLPQPLITALDYLKKADFTRLEPGIHEIQGRDIFAIVSRYTTKPADQIKPEVHEKYVDVQYVHQGQESIAVSMETSANTVVEDHLADRDVLFYAPVKHTSILNMQPGCFAIFYPSDVHAPSASIDGPEEVIKVVVKVRLSLLPE